MLIKDHKEFVKRGECISDNRVTDNERYLSVIFTLVTVRVKVSVMRWRSSPLAAREINRKINSVELAKYPKNCTV